MKIFSMITTVNKIFKFPPIRFCISVLQMEEFHTACKNFFSSNLELKKNSEMILNLYFSKPKPYQFCLEILGESLVEINQKKRKNK
jgi:hypothetical protein